MRGFACLMREKGNAKRLWIAFMVKLKTETGMLRLSWVRQFSPGSPMNKANHGCKPVGGSSGQRRIWESLPLPPLGTPWSVMKKTSSIWNCIWANARTARFGWQRVCFHRENKRPDCRCRAPVSGRFGATGQWSSKLQPEKSCLTRGGIPFRSGSRTGKTRIP